MTSGPRSVDELLAVLWRRRWWVLGTFVLVVAAAAALTASLPNVYRAKGYLLVQPERPSANDFEATQVSTTLNTTYSELLQTRNVSLAVADALPDRLRGAEADVSVEPVTDSQLIGLSADAGSPEDAQLVANTYASTFVRIAERFTSGTTASGTVSVAVPAARPAAPRAPRPKLYLALAMILGALLGAAMGLLRHRLDQRLDISPTTNELFGLPIIARIPGGSAGAVRGIVDHDGGDREARRLAESFRLLLANLSFANVGERPNTVAVLSSSASEGKSLTAIALGRAASELGISTLLVDADLRRPGLTERLSGKLDPSAAGLSSFLVRSALSLTEAAAEVDRALSVVPAGPIPPNPAALLGSKALPDFDRRAQRSFDMVIYDTPPLSIAADASLVASIAEGAILVVDVRKARRRVVMQAVDQLIRSRANVLGVVLNRVQENQTGYYGYYGYSSEPLPEASEAAEGDAPKASLGRS